MTSLFDNYHTVNEWEDAAARDGRIIFNVIYYVMGKRVLDHVTGMVKCMQPNGQVAHRCVMWHSNGLCYVGKERLPEFDIKFND